ncbi:aspartate-semialdehyde dehydrogenase [Pseudomonas sp. Marseille-QA0892]
MIPPIPNAALPVVTHPEAVKARTEVAPVAPAVDTPNDSGVGLAHRDPAETLERLREEERRRRKKKGMQAARPPSSGATIITADDVIEDLPRQGVWIDVEV